MIRNRLPVWLVAIWAVASVAGCGSNYGGRQEVKGTIKLKGTPLDQGQIMFMPISGDNATKEGAGITNGEYKIDRAHGLLPGK